MRIAITFGCFLPVPPARGGATEKIWFALARRLAARGHDITLFTRTWPDWPDEEQIDGVRIRRLPGRDHCPRLWQNLLLDLRWSLRLRRALPPDALVISHNVTLPILLRMPGLRHRAPVTVVLGRMPKGQVRLYGKLDRIYATSEAVATRVRHENPDTNNRLRILRNSIDWHALQSPAPQPPSAAAPILRIGYAGRIHPEKGLDGLIRAGALLARDRELPPWEIVFIGPVTPADGGGGEAHRDALLALAREHGIADRVRFLPPAWDSAALAQFYQTLSIFCYPTRAEQGEGLSVAPIEAMAAGAAPVLSALPCYRDLILPGVNGLLFDHRSANPDDALAAQLTILLRNPSDRATLAAAARATARHFDYDALAAELEADLTTLNSKP
ncbi:glycosyltransferase family 4 protein [Geminisphaera colitermitum]|uniref:glycosyltransferase family 4 protein n=1 Tax=Geminisphaera colitermitum TaxID=1148786 RepID=UPI000158C544|nr:glycosyltransferase family 4 protein [Geminisphaera colitermitum]